MTNRSVYILILLAVTGTLNCYITSNDNDNDNDNDNNVMKELMA